MYTGIYRCVKHIHCVLCPHVYIWMYVHACIFPSAYHDMMQPLVVETTYQDGRGGHDYNAPFRTWWVLPRYWYGGGSRYCFRIVLEIDNPCAAAEGFKNRQFPLGCGKRSKSWRRLQISGTTVEREKSNTHRAALLLAQHTHTWPRILFVCIRVYVYIYGYIYIYIYTCIYMYVNTNIYTHLATATFWYVYVHYIYIHGYTYTNLHIYLCTCIHIYAHTWPRLLFCMCMYIYIYIWIFVYIYTQIHMCMCIHIYTHTWLRLFFPFKLASIQFQFLSEIQTHLLCFDIINVSMPSDSNNQKKSRARPSTSIFCCKWMLILAWRYCNVIIENYQEMINHSRTKTDKYIISDPRAKKKKLLQQYIKTIKR